MPKGKFFDKAIKKNSTFYTPWLMKTMISYTLLWWAKLHKKMWSSKQVATCKLQNPNIFDCNNLQKPNVFNYDSFQKRNILKCIDLQKLVHSNAGPMQQSTPFFRSPLHLLSFVTYNFILSFLYICNSPLHFSQDTFSSHFSAVASFGFNIRKCHPFPSFATPISHMKHKRCKMCFDRQPNLPWTQFVPSWGGILSFEPRWATMLVYLVNFLNIVPWIGQARTFDVVYVQLYR